MKFKENHMREQFEKIPVFLREIAFDFSRISRKLGIDPVITRILDPVSGESGVHTDGRAIDFRDEFNGKFTYTVDQRLALIHYINARYPRKDGKQTIIWHSFGGGPHHFHIQISTLTKTH